MQQIGNRVISRTPRSAKLLWPQIVDRLARTRTLLAEYLWTFVAETGIMISQICVYKLAARILGTEGFSEYAVARRTLALVYPISLLGLIVALPRFIAHSTSRERGSQSGYLGAALFCILATTGTFFAVANLRPAQVSSLFFGSRAYAGLVLPLSVTVAGLALHTVTYAYFRGHLAMARANSLQFVNLGVVPVLAFTLSHPDVRSILFTLGALNLAISTVAIAFSVDFRRLFISQWERLKELLRYGTQRLPGDLALLALFTLPTTITAHAQGIRPAGLVAFSMLFLTTICNIFNPIGVVLLPKASRMFAEGENAELREHVLRLAEVTAVIGGVLSLVVGLIAGPLIRFYLGPEYASAAGIVRITVLGAVPYCLFLLLSHVIDAFHYNAITAAIEIVAFVAACAGCTVVWFTSKSVVGFLLSFMIGVLLLGVLAVVFCLRIFRYHVVPVEVLEEAPHVSD